MHASGFPANTPVTLAVKLFNEKEKLVRFLKNKTNYYSNLSDEKKKEYAKTAYLNKKAKLKKNVEEDI